MARKYFCAYHSYLTMIELLTDAERGRLFVACLTYSMSGEVPELRGNERFIWPAMKAQIDADANSYESVCQSQREKANKRWHKDDAAACNGMPGNAGDANEKEKENIKERTTNVVRKKDAFRHPSLQEVTDYCAERRNAVNPSSFISYYDSVGWKVGKNPMKDWKAAVRTWEQRDDRRPPGKRMGANAGYAQTKISDAEFDALFESEGF